MSVRIQLDNEHSFYTNLDFISGRVILQLPNDENVSAIHVKLEGESRTMLMRPMVPPGQAQLYANRPVRQVPVGEMHKVLYRVSQVFPSESAANPTSLGMAYTLRAGKHEYPFRFKIPFNNGCSDPQQQQQMGGFGLGGLQQMQYRHVKRTLPPSLTGFPGEAEIRYYIKVTVQRPSIFRENRRSAIGFKFLPIEPPRPPPTTNEVFARRPYVFQYIPAAPKKKGNVFSNNNTNTATLSDTPPKGEVDARLPSPAILTCNEPLPLRILVKKTGASPESVYLTSMQIRLLGTTEVRAADVNRHEASTWVMLSVAGLTREIGKPTDAVGTESFIDPELWNSLPLPNTVAPSFSTCNIDRKYELEVTVGLAYGSPGNLQPQTIQLPLRFAVEIFSGIKPPPELLHAMTSRPPNMPQRPSSIQRPPQASSSSSQAPAPAYDPLYPPQLPPGANPQASNDAPPSYEDAMADDITPVNGSRREYSGITDVNAPDMGDAKGSMGRR